MSIRLFLADDHRVFRDGLRPLLESHDGIEVVGEAEDGLATLKSCRELKPDVAVLDISMRGLNGIEVTRILTRDLPNLRVVILSMHSDRRFVVEALRAGARGYVLKEAGFDELQSAVVAVANGRLHFSAAVGEQVLDEFIRHADVEPNSAFSILSARERETLQLLAEGLSMKEIAAQLHLSVKTIESHRKTTMDKLGIRSIAELTKYAIREGLTNLD